MKGVNVAGGNARNVITNVKFRRNGVWEVRNAQRKSVPLKTLCLQTNHRAILAVELCCCTFRELSRMW